MLLKHVIVCILVQSQVYVVEPFDAEQLLSLNFLQAFSFLPPFDTRVPSDYWNFPIGIDFCM